MFGSKKEECVHTWKVKSDTVLPSPNEQLIQTGQVFTELNGDIEPLFRKKHILVHEIF